MPEAVPWDGFLCETEVELWACLTTVTLVFAQTKSSVRNTRDPSCLTALCRTFPEPKPRAVDAACGLYLFIYLTVDPLLYISVYDRTSSIVVIP